MLKLDFAEAFDMIEHSAIVKVFEALGFPDIWMNWLSNILSIASSLILLNGVPHRQFLCIRGVI